MGKPGLEGRSVEAILLDAVSRTGWALCIGAGTSVPLFPGWFSLVTRLIAQEVGQPRASELASELLSQFSPDALIQAAYDRFGPSPRAFIDLLAQQLYHDLRTRLGDDDWALISSALSAYRPAHLGLRDWRAFLLIARKDFACTTAGALARVLTQAIGTDLTPAAILSFNAESLLYALVTAMLIERDVPQRPWNPRKARCGSISTL
jgi:hypothetical protein